MTRVALLCSEPIRAATGGIGVRFVEIARHLAALDFEVRLVSPAEPAVAAEMGLQGVALHRYEPQRRGEWLAGCDAVVAQGQLANDLVLADPGLPLVFDFYDPWLIENLAYAEELGLEPYRNDHHSWVLQLGRADLVLCASEEQRLFYLGFLAAIGRIHPRRFELDPSLAGLVAIVPFGCDPVTPRPAAPGTGPRLLLFGGVYDWYDVDTLLEALARLRSPRWELTAVRSANPDSTPQRQLARLERAKRRPGWEDRIVVIDRVPAAQRTELVRRSELLVAPHAATLESELSFRTRFLDALAAGCPVVATRGGSLSRRIEERSAGWVVPEGDPAALAAAIDEILEGGAEVESRRRAGYELAAELGWPSALAPLVAFLRRPQRDRARGEFVRPPETFTPREGAVERLWREARRRLGR